MDMSCEETSTLFWYATTYADNTHGVVHEDLLDKMMTKCDTGFGDTAVHLHGTSQKRHATRLSDP
jgi:hypothetical protein